jgi:hypothetical protein
MTLSNQTMYNLASALKPEVLNQVFVDERFTETMLTLISESIQDKLGPIDDFILADLSFIILDSISLK